MNVNKHENWAELKRQIEQLQDGGDEFLWRGQSNSTWKLKSSIYRFFETQDILKEDRRERENQAEQFFVDYVNNSPDAKFNLVHKSQILMLMQHYGCPTRMLDWSKSPYIATFFAIQDLSRIGAIFALNLTKYQSLVRDNVILDDYDGSVLQVIPKRVFGHLERGEITFPIPLITKPITPREAEQQTAFLVDMQLEKSLEDCFIGNTCDYLWKFEFDSKNTLINFTRTFDNEYRWKAYVPRVRRSCFACQRIFIWNK